MQTMPRPQRSFSSTMTEVTAPRVSGRRSWGSTKVDQQGIPTGYTINDLYLTMTEQTRNVLHAAACTGPALYVYNNASFTEEDWEGIQLAGRSFKRNDPNKVGRFGIGFNSVYHITGEPTKHI